MRVPTWILVMLWAHLTCVADAAAPPELQPGMSRIQVLEVLRQAEPAERWNLVAPVLREADLHTVRRTEVTQTLTERGALEAATQTEVVCRLKSLAKPAAGAI